jgi:hypothetical protein
MSALKRILPALGVLALFAPLARARIESDLASPEKRHLSVEKAVQVAKQAAVAPIPDTVPLPFNPPGFDLTDAEEAAAALEAARRSGVPGAALVPALPTDRQLLETITSKISPSGSIFLGGKPMLMFGKRFVKTGSHFTVTYKGTDYDLELTDIDGSNFTLRYNREEITRPIQTGKSP